MLVLELLIGRYLGRRRYMALHAQFEGMNSVAYEFSPTQLRLPVQEGHL